MARKMRTMVSYSSQSSSEYGSPLPMAQERNESPFLGDSEINIYWTESQRVNEEIIRKLMERFKLQPVPHYCPLTLEILPNHHCTTRPNYLLLAALAIYGSPEKKLRLSDIYRAIDERFPRLILERPAYKRSLRHKLSLEPLFVNIKTSSRGDSVVGRGNFWILDGSRVDFPKPRRRKSKAARYTSPSPTRFAYTNPPFNNNSAIQSWALDDQTCNHSVEPPLLMWQAPHIEQWAEHSHSVDYPSFAPRSHLDYLA